MTTVIQFPTSDAKPLKDRLSEELRALMGRYGVSQVVLARWMGLEQAQLSKRINGRIPWRIDEIEAVAEAFGVHPAALMGGYATDPRPGGPDGGLPIFKYGIRDSNPEPAAMKHRASDLRVLPAAA